MQIERSAGEVGAAGRGHRLSPAPKCPAHPRQPGRDGRRRKRRGMGQAGSSQEVMHNSTAPLSARLFPRGGSLQQTLFMGQSGSLGGRARLRLRCRLLAQCERLGPAPGIKMNPSSVPPSLPPPGQQVIHVTQDLDTDLEALFNSVMNPKPSSWRKKILPESFFKEPDSGSHSRQSSTDSSGGHPGPRLAGGAQHVRSHSSPASLQLGTGAGAAGGPAQQHAHLRQQSYDVTDELPLPPGWEMTFTATGQRYFLNHIEKITTWQDPRKAMNQPLNHGSLHHAITSTSVPQRSMAVSQPNLVMNHQHQQQVVPSNLSAQNHPTPNPPSGLMSVPNALTTQQQQQQKLRLQRIQMERERIRMRQEELMRQEAALCRQLPMEETMASVNPPAMTTDMRSITNNSSDPFLNGGPYHSREQSTDSGLGLGCYSVPTTPEDFLSNMDEMDTGENTAQTPMAINPQQTRFPDFLDCLPGTNVDLGTLESEDLIPLFNDVESALNKSEPFLTWL
ncbi:WW domain-containing transcription regulator protein 1 isoform X2 [Peromyscus californicus insignis]|uniref:WW domain-containing transcription regulator protein 1 isoform X2 n=3 Tax=Peromyscus TaxID=10040 RepID=UPI0022A6E2C0|nr:WW domain-containing transcription regulator protein 1 isoform X2 [Peromyscus californicus insignis]